ncbi:MAG: hypothetical protein ACK5N8_07425 [Alphaproteobacteria bacterium]
MGGTEAAIATGGLNTAAKVNDMYSERKARTAELKNIRAQQSINAAKKKNILEQQLAQRRAKVGSMGISSSGSSMAVQNRMVSDATKDISYDDYSADVAYSKTYNAYQARLRSQILGSSSDATSNYAKTIK